MHQCFFSEHQASFELAGSYRRQPKVFATTPRLKRHLLRGYPVILLCQPSRQRRSPQFVDNLAARLQLRVLKINNIHKQLCTASPLQTGQNQS
jgi:hypothetical protein